MDYSKWLGPDWKATYEGAGINISNHTGFAEIIANFALITPFTSYVAKAATNKIPGLGYVMRNIQCLFVESRGKSGSKESKSVVMKQIQEAQELAE